MRSRRVILAVDIIIIIIAMFGAVRVWIRPAVPFQLIQFETHMTVGEISDRQAASNIASGDIILGIRDEQVMEIRDLEFVVDHNLIGDYLPLVIERDGDTFIDEVRLVAHYEWKTTAIQVFVSFVFFATALILIWFKADDSAARAFQWALIWVGAMMMSTWGSYTLPFRMGELVQVLDLLANPMIPVSLLHFTLRFPRERGPWVDKSIVAFYAIGLLLFAWLLHGFGIAFISAKVTDFNAAANRFDMMRIFLLITLILSFVSIGHAFKTMLSRVDRKKLRWLVFGLSIAAIAFIALWAIPQLVFGRGLISVEALQIIMLLVPITFATAIIRYQFLDIDFILNRSTVYTFVIVVLAGVYGLTVGIVAAVVSRFTIASSMIASGMGAVLVAILFEPVRNRSQNWVNKAFFRVDYDYRKAQKKISDQINMCQNAGELSELLMRWGNEIFQVRTVGIIRLNPEADRWEIISQRGWSSARAELDSLGELISDSSNMVSHPDWVESESTIQNVDAEALSAFGLALVIPLVTREGGMQTAFVLGPKMSDRRFSVEDIDLLQTAADQAGLVLTQLDLQRKLIVEHQETERLAELNQLKSFFVSSVSHELKTPLTSIKLFAEMLHSHSDLISKEKIIEYAGIIEGETDRLSRLVQNILDFNALERQAPTYSLEPHDLNKLVKRVMVLMEYQFRMGGFKVKEDLANKHLHVNCDEDAIIEVLINLFSNAIKYSRNIREISVSGEVTASGCILSIADKGVGMTREQQKQIFEPFYRVRNETSRRTGGVGIGLTLVKAIIDAHGGEIRCESELGEGSRFIITLPGQQI